MTDPVWTASGEGIHVRYVFIGDTLLRFNDDGTVHRWAGWGWRKA